MQRIKLNFSDVSNGSVYVKNKTIEYETEYVLHYI